MEEFFVDSTFLVARFNVRDDRHKEALAFVGELAAGAMGAFRVVTTDYVFDETVTAILARTRNHALAANAGRSVLNSKAWRLEFLGRRDFEKGWEFFLDRGDKRWSFTDCMSFTFMEDRGFRKALAFDENFRQAGFATLP